MFPVSLSHSPMFRRFTRASAGRYVFAVVLVLLLPTMVGLSFDFGYSWDEKPRQKYGELIWEYLGGSRDRSVFEGGNPADELYGGFFDVTCVAVQKVFPRSDPYVVRHATNAVFGWVAVLSCGLLARYLLGAWGGVLAMVLLVLSPRFLGHAMNNPKDLPFAALSTLALYFIFRTTASYPFIGWRLGVKLTAALALALAVRAAGLLLIGYLGVTVACRLALARDFSPRRLAATAGRLAAIAAGALLLATVAWPWALVRPIYGPIVAFFRLSKFDWPGSVLYRGVMIPASQLPWDYVLTWLFITTPFVILAGAACSWLAGGDERDSPGRSAIVALWGFFLFPVVLIVVRGSTLYDGIRHLLFLVPLLTVLAAAGWIALLRHRSPAVRRLSAALLCVGLLEPLLFEARNHPNEVVYFNALAGGPAGAYARYDLDYWGNCVYQSVDWAAGVARKAGMPVVVSGGHSPHVEIDARRFQSLVYRPYELGQHHLEIYLLRGAPGDLKSLAARPALARVETADGAPLCLVLPGPRFPELAARLERPAGQPSARATHRTDSAASARLP